MFLSLACSRTNRIHFITLLDHSAEIYREIFFLPIHVHLPTLPTDPTSGQIDTGVLAADS